MPTASVDKIEVNKFKKYYKKNNKKQGRARIERGSVEDLSFVPTASVDKIFHMNCIYFWPGIGTVSFFCLARCSSVAAVACSVAARYCTVSLLCECLLCP